MSHNSDYINNIKGAITTYIVRVELLDSDENTIREITSDILDGSINISLQNGSRRTGSITLANSGGEYSLDSGVGGIWIDNKFRVQTGIMVDGVEQLFNQGIFVIGETNESNDSDGNAVANFELYDKFAYLDGTLAGTIENTFTIARNTNIVDVMRFIFNTAQTDGIQISYDIKPLISEPSTFVTPYTIYVDKGKTFFDLINELANAINYSVYFDTEGYPRFESIIDPNNEPPMLEFEESDILKSNLNKRIEVSRIRNSIRVEGITWDNGVLHDATSTQTTGATAISRIGRRSEYISDDVIYNDTLAQQRADFERDQRSKISETLNITYYPTDNLDVGRVIQATDSRINITDAIYQVRQINLPLLKDTTASMDTQRTIDLA